MWKGGCDEGAGKEAEIRSWIGIITSEKSERRLKGWKNFREKELSVGPLVWSGLSVRRRRVAGR